MESISLHKRGQGITTKKIKKIKKNAKQLPKMPKIVTTNVQLQLAKHMRIPYFRDIFMCTYQQGKCIETRAVP